jgi:serine acetyltransferase
MIFRIFDVVLVRGFMNSQLQPSLDIGFGLILNHPHMIIIHPSVVIGNNVQINAGARIIGNITLGDNVIVGANAVVTKTFPDGAVHVGIPAINIA